MKGEGIYTTDSHPPDGDPYRALVEQSPTMVWRAGLDERCDYVNATWLAFTGRLIEDVVGHGLADSIHPDDHDPYLALVHAHYAQRRPFEVEHRLRRADGAYRYVLDRGAPYHDTAGSFAGFIGSGIDVDDRRYRDGGWGADLFEMSLDNLCVAGLDGYFKRINHSWTRTLGWTRQELLSMPSIDLVHPDDRSATLAARQRLEDGVPLRSLVNRYRCKDGTYRWFEWRSVAHVDRELIYAAARDVTDQKEAQRALGELTESLTTTLNSIADGVIATDAEGRVARMNPVAQRLTGWTARQARGQPLDRVFRAVHAETRVAATLPVERTLREGIAAELGSHILLIGRHGAELPVATSCAPMRDAEGRVRGAVLVFRDMTADKEAKELQQQMQRQLVVAERMASVGTLAAGVAHEINNPLAYVMANLELLVAELASLGVGADAAKMAKMAELAELAGEASEGAERIRKVVSGLRTFARAEEGRRAVIDVRPVLELCIALASNEVRHRARLIKEFGDVPPVVADDALLSQVFINLLVNAAQAMPEGDILANEIRIVTSTDATGRAVVEIRDTGPGIPAHVLGRIFDPFFTTKAPGLGTGLGLSICHNIVASVGGEITAHSQEGHGTTFRITLPAAPGPLAEAAAPAALAPPAVARRAAVLIVDDDRAVGVALGRVLREHDVTIVTTAKEALALLTSERSFDVVLSDLMMPEMSGMELYDELARIRPQAAARMVFVTGGAFTPHAHAFLDRVPNQRMHKPFEATAVRALIHELMTTAAL